MHSCRTKIGRWGFVVLLGSVLTLIVPALLTDVGAAGSFATPAFQMQWTAGEGVTPNFWGPLVVAHDGQTEAYKEGSLDFSESGPANPGAGMRLVQYFDKARMELTHPAQGLVTNGLLTVELISGRLQLGDNTFEQRASAAVPMAGDANNVGPTYATLNALSAQILVAVSPTPGEATTRALTPAGQPIAFSGGTGFARGTIAAYDQTTGHNIPAAFVSFRDQVGLASVGLAIAEPFWSNVKVAGKPTDVLIQAFERRVLTYTPTNPAAFQVEFGNIGSQYYTWRYRSPSAPVTTATPAPTPPLPTPPATTTTPATATPAATTVGSSGHAQCSAFASASFGTAPSSVSRNTPIVLTLTARDASGAVCADGTQVVIADTGVTSTFAGGGKAPNGASFVVVPVTNGVATATITISALNASAPGPVSVGAYNLRPMADLQTGGFGIPVSPEYKPTIT